ncbi:hypothetical protein GW17_00053010, partial [Ensete ventricosum]
SFPNNEGLREPVGRRRLGHQRRASEDGLVQGAVHRVLQELHRRRLCLEQLRGRLLRHGESLMDVAGARPECHGQVEVGSEELHDL